MRPRGRRRSSDFCHNDTIVSTTHSKGRFLADSGRPCRRTVQTYDDESPRAPGDFHHPRERRAGLPSLRFPTSVLLRAGGRASRAGDDFPHPCGWLPSSARAESTEWRNSSLPKEEESPYSTLSRASLGHRLRAKEFGERSHATNQPKIRPTFRVPRRIRTCERIEMLSVVHHSFARVRIAPRHARVEPARPSSFYGGGLLHRVLDAFLTARSDPVLLLSQ